MMIWLLVGACVLAAVPAGLRWLRVAQREHYIPWEVRKFADRWWFGAGFVNRFLITTAIGLVFFSALLEPWFVFVAPVVIAVGPVGLSVKGVTSPLAWTARLRRVAFLAGFPYLVLLAIGGLLDLQWLVALALVLLPVLIDVALWMLRPYENRQGDQWVEKASAKLRAVGPKVVAITGSYGKTTTKAYLAHILGGSMRVVASPASFNNRMGLARAINENLTPGTEVFIAEMGTYGYGEIAELCEWMSPDIGAMVSIGPVHLERFGTTRDIARAKSEILDRADVGVICVDYAELREVADERKSDMRIIEVSAIGGIHVDGNRVTDAPEDVFGVNLAVALGICSALGVDPGSVLGRTRDLPKAEHRQSIIQSGAGFTIIDDTFNSNPDGAGSALLALAKASPEGRKAVVTPGMVELGKVQDEENEEFAKKASMLANDLVIVGRTNREALFRGSANGTASVTVVNSRAEAIDWVKQNMGPGDAVLYENDLPDHYP